MKKFFRLTFSIIKISSLSLIVLAFTIVLSINIVIIYKPNSIPPDVKETLTPIIFFDGMDNFKPISPIANLSENLKAVAINGGKSDDNTHVSLGILLYNKGDKTLFLKIVKPDTMIIDDTGGQYHRGDISGISVCDKRDASTCVQDSKVLMGMTQLDPGKHLSMTFYLYSLRRSKGKKLTFSTVLISRSVKSSQVDDNRSDDEKIKQLSTINLSVPAIKIKGSFEKIR